MESEMKIECLALKYQEPKIDTVDEKIIRQRIVEQMAESGPCVGDLVRMPNTSIDRPVFARICINRGWMQLTDLELEITEAARYGSFYLAGSACSYSGGCGMSIDETKLINTGQTVMARAWIFHHNDARGHNGVDFMAPFRVWETSEYITPDWQSCKAIRDLIGVNLSPSVFA